ALARVPAEVPLAVPLVAGPGSACLLAALLGWMAARPGLRLWGLLASLPFWLGPLPSGPGRLELVMLDVGQGDAVLLKDGRHGLLVDGGGWRRGDLGGSVLLPALLRQGLIGLEGAVLSHGDQDHCGGLLDLGSYLPLGTLWVGPDGSGAAAPAGGGCRHELLAAGGPTATLVAGERLRWRSWSFEVLSPEAATRAAGNDASLVLQARAADGLTVLLTGDIGAEVEARLLARFGPRLRAGVLKVAHHGSRFSSSPRFLAAVAPRLALISVGAGNLYGHPAASTLERLRSAGAQAWRTDVSGGVRVRLGSSGRLEIRALEP
ncbi:MAG TPA: ComEC/Rec2 family competence protein, partial [Thermoanaerobaculia bacterium]|nr:ComEC/Rec2 family competence protein [Thermoanaerobaculia bacterium]